MDKNYIASLKQILAASGVTQAELANRLGVTFAALNRWLHAHAVPHRSKQTAIERLHREIVVYPAYDPKAVSRIARHAAKFCRKNLWKQIIRHEALQEDLLLEHTYNSTSIEGTTFTKRETETIIFSKQMIPDKSLAEHLEVTNHAAILKQILQGSYDEPLSENLVRNLHRGLLQGIRQDAGSYSRYPRAIRGVEMALTHPKDIPEEISHLIKRWKKHKKVTIREIAVFHAEFELIHPFGDGNGRVGRLLMVIQCLQKNYPPIIIENARKAEYYDVLEYAQKKSEGPFVAFLASELERTVKLLRKHRLK